jgi:hypothetical protein
MRIALGGTFAKCSACQGEDFYPAFPLTPDRREVLVCAQCEHQTIFAELVGKPGASARAAKMPWATAAAAAPARQNRPRRARGR